MLETFWEMLETWVSTVTVTCSGLVPCGAVHIHRRYAECIVLTCIYKTCELTSVQMPVQSLIVAWFVVSSKVVSSFVKGPIIVFTFGDIVKRKWNNACKAISCAQSKPSIKVSYYFSVNIAYVHLVCLLNSNAEKKWCFKCFSYFLECLSNK